MKLVWSDPTLSIPCFALRQWTAQSSCCCPSDAVGGPGDLRVLFGEISGLLPRRLDSMIRWESMKLWFILYTMGAHKSSWTPISSGKRLHNYGKIHLFCSVNPLCRCPFSSSRRVGLEGKPLFSYGFPMVFLWFSHFTRGATATNPPEHWQTCCWYRS